MLIIRVHVAVKNNDLKLSGIKKKKAQIVCAVNFVDTAEQRMPGS